MKGRLNDTASSIADVDPFLGILFAGASSWKGMHEIGQVLWSRLLYSKSRIQIETRFVCSGFFRCSCFSLQPFKFLLTYAEQDMYLKRFKIMEGDCSHERISCIENQIGLLERYDASFMSLKTSQVPKIWGSGFQNVPYRSFVVFPYRKNKNFLHQISIEGTLRRFRCFRYSNGKMTYRKCCKK